MRKEIRTFCARLEEKIVAVPILVWVYFYLLENKSGYFFHI